MSVIWKYGQVAALGALLLGAPLSAAMAAETAPAEAAHGESAFELAADEAAEHAAEGEHGSAGMPQLETTSYPSQILWLIISFALLYYLMKRRALPRVAEILEKRQERLSADLDRAVQLRKEAEEVLAKHEAIVAEAKARAQARVREARDSLAEEIARRQAKLDKDLSGRIGEAETRIAAARDAALAELETVAADVARTATARLIGVEVSDEDARQALQQIQREVA